MTPPPDVPDLIKALPMGTVRGTAAGKAYLTTRSTFGEGRALKVVAEELGGPDYISLNLYDLAGGPRLYPCEMPAEKVIGFLRAFVPERASSG